MAKKQVWKTIFKYIGIGAGICTGIVGLVTAFVAITGGFNPPYVPIKSCTFNIDTDKYQGLSNGIPVFVINEDDTFIVNPNPDDCTELDGKLQIRAGDRLIKDIQVEQENEDGEKEFVSAEKEGTKYKITLGEPFKIVLVENHAEITDTRIIEMHVDCESEFCDAKVFVDSALTEFNLKYEKIGATTQDEQLFEGDYIYAYIDVASVLDKSALTMNSFVELTKDFKQYKFEIDNEEIAEIVEVIINTTNNSPLNNYKTGFPFAKIKILKSGTFNVSLNICNLYKNEESILSQEDYDNLENDDLRDEYDEWLETVIVSSGLDFEVSDIEIGSISATKTQKTLKLYDKNTKFTASELELSVNPKDIAGSPFTSDDLKSRIADLEIAAGYIVDEGDDYDIQLGTESNPVYIKLSSDYILTQKEAGVQEPVWAVTVIKEYNLPENACLVVCLETNDETFFDYIPVKIEPVDSVDLVIKNGSDVIDLIELDYDKSSDTQKTYNDLDIDWVFDLESNKKFSTLIDGNLYPYKKVIYALYKDGSFTFNDGITKLELTDDGYVLTPLSKGSSSICAVLFKTNIDGNPVSADGTVIEDLDTLLTNGQIVAYSSEIVVKVQQVLKVIADETITLYTQENNDYSEIDDEYALTSDTHVDSSKEYFTYDEENKTYVKVQQPVDEDIKNYYEKQVGMYTIKKDKTGSVYEVTMYNGKKAYLKLNVNDADAMKQAFNDTLIFRLDNEIAQVDKFVKLGSNLVEATIDGEKCYLLSIEISGVTDESLIENLFVELNGKQICHLEIKAKKFILNSLTLTSNGKSSESADAEIFLVVNSQTDNYFWTIDSGKSQNKALEVTINKFPLEAEGHDEIEYKLYTLKDADFDISTLGTLTDEIIAQHFVEDYSIINIKSGYPTYTSDDKPVLQFDVFKAGKVVLIASCTRFDDDKKIFSNPYVIEATYPYLEEQQYNYGTNYETLDTDFYYEKTADTEIDTDKTYYVFDGNNYTAVAIPYTSQLVNYYEKQLTKFRKVVASYDGQLTNLLDFIGFESKAIAYSGEGVEGQKLGLKWRLSDSEEVSTTPLRSGLYQFEIVSSMKDFTFEYVTDNGNIINYLKTNRVTEKVYIKIKITTKFGYEFTKTYNYVLIPDYSITTDNNTIEMTANDDKTLFAIKIDTKENEENKVDLKEIVNDGGLFFITNSTSTNYRVGNESKLTGFDGEAITVIYLPEDMKESVTNMLKNNSDVSYTTNGNIVTLTLGSTQYELRFVLRFSYNDPNGDVKIENGQIKTRAIVEGISPEITLNGYYCFKNETESIINEYMENNIYKFKVVVTPIMEIKLYENTDNNVNLSLLGNSLETTFENGKAIDLSDIVKLELINPSDTQPTYTVSYELVGKYDNFKVENDKLIMTGSTIETYNLQINCSFTVTLNNDLIAYVNYTLNLLVSPK